MITSQELKKGSFIRHGGKIYKVQEHDYHMGGGRAGGMVHAKLKDVLNGHTAEFKFDPHDKIENLDIERRKMKFLYGNPDGFNFMDETSFEQFLLTKESLGQLASFLKEEMEVDAEFYDGNPIHVSLPEKIEIAVTSTAPPPKGGGSDNTFKEATLEGNITILVPHFIKTGDKIFVHVESRKYLDRAG